MRYEPPYLILPYNTNANSGIAIAKFPNGQYSSTLSLTGFTINSNTGLLTFNNVFVGVYYIPITYTLLGSSIIINYTLIVKPTVFYSIAQISTYYTFTTTSVTPLVNPNGGIFTATFNDAKLSPLLDTITINSLSGIIYTSNTLRVGIYNLLVSYTVNDSVETTQYTIIIYPIFNYPIGFINVNYDVITYSESPITNPPNGKFTTISGFYVDVSSGIIEIKNTNNVGVYQIPITYTYNSLSILSPYNITITPQYYYKINDINIIIRLWY